MSLLILLGGRLMEIESRLLPCGLHVVGSPPSAAEAVATLVNIAEIDRPDNDPPVAGLPGVLARCINRSIEEIYLNNNKAISCLPVCWLLHVKYQQNIMCCGLFRAAHVYLQD